MNYNYYRKETIKKLSNKQKEKKKRPLESLNANHLKGKITKIHTETHGLIYLMTLGTIKTFQDGTSKQPSTAGKYSCNQAATYM